MSEGVKALLLDAGGTQDTVEALSEIDGARMVALPVDTRSESSP